MSDIIDDKIKALEFFEEHLCDFMHLTVTDNEHVIVDMNARVQLYEQGVINDGTPIAEYRPYRPVTVQIKLMKGQPTNRVTLYDEGDFHASFRVISNNISFFIDATDVKTEELIKKYSEQIFGLTDENLNELIWEYIYPDLITHLKTLLQ